ncbi:MAG: glycoside hydrolase family 140 protein [Arachidicoccus sp.]|nr:glycoside hydrolase family 140 protein [Arachidicoccus sp.]
MHLHRHVDRLRVFLLIPICGFLYCVSKPYEKKPASEIYPLLISDNHRFFKTKNGDPFFWMGDTGWLLFTNLNDEETKIYLDDRKKKGFNVIQVMLLHGLSDKNIYGRYALINSNLSQPDINNNDAHNYWKRIDNIIDLAAKKGMYIAMVPVWGNVIKSGKVSEIQAKSYASFLALRYKNKPNIIWMNGGDIKGSDSLNIWNIIGETLHKEDPNHLITFHPRGRAISSLWFQNADWMSFNVFQSGHRRYDQDTSADDLHYGEDNYKYVQAAYNLKPIKPVLDAEPSYENIPQGLHDTSQPKWKAADVRRYAYWSVFAGACGFTYGNNSIMQFHNGADKPGAYGATKDWRKALNDSGALQMIYLKNLMHRNDYFSRIPDQSVVVDQGEKYKYIAVTRSNAYLLAYDYTGRKFSLNLENIKVKSVVASWYNPRNGSKTAIGKILSNGIVNFNPPGEEKNGNDWVLILDYIKS